MNHFGGTALSQVDYHRNVAMKLDYPKLCNLVTDAGAADQPQGVTRPGLSAHLERS